MSKRLAAQAERVYWHGGAPGLDIGDVLLPGTQLPEHRALNAIQEDGWEAMVRPDFVYVTADQDLALDFAILNSQTFGRPSTVYEVEPLGACEHDPDYPKDVSFRCKRARVVAVAQPEIVMTTESKHAALRYKTYDDGFPFYDREGYPAPNRRHRALGFTAADLRPAGQWATFEQITFRASYLVRTRHPTLTQSDLNRLWPFN